MKHAFSVLILLLAPVALFSQNQTLQAEKFQTGKVLAVVEHPEGRVFDWVNHGTAPIYDGYAFYDINVQLDNKCYVVRYESQTGYYPSAWQPGNEVKARIESGRIYLQRYDSAEVPTSILKRCPGRH
ncbi:MAG TPA: hypothetical protein VK738_14455 [Terriglobales bacterium]|jgi:hypothetical protein|nr:hypothetical protein [Terriglobales bacterium]